MKKLVLLLAVAFSVSLFSCGGDKAAEATADTVAPEVVEEAVAVEEVVVDTAAAAAACDSAATEAPATAE